MPRHSRWSLPRLGVTTPVGYSFYAFSAASYLIDIYARRLSGSHHPGHVALYVAYFPKIFAGPIERATAFLPQVVGRPARRSRSCAVLGLQLIGWGLFKKVVIADNLAPLVDRNFGIVAFASPIELLVSVYFFAFQIYCDFSGYTDIAIGVSLLFGLQLMENFRRPYLSRSTAEFWGERWHISLGRWFRDYLYIPLGGSRAGPLRRYLNIMVVFVVSGLWHAGLGYGVGWTFLDLGRAQRRLSVDRAGDARPVAAARRAAAGRAPERCAVAAAHSPDLSSDRDFLGVLPRQIGRRRADGDQEDRDQPRRNPVAGCRSIRSPSEHGMGFGLIALLLAVEIARRAPADGAAAGRGAGGAALGFLLPRDLRFADPRPMAGEGVHLHAVLRGLFGASRI